MNNIIKNICVGLTRNKKKNKKSNQISATLSTLNKMQCAKYNYNHCKMYNTKRKKKVKIERRSNCDNVFLTFKKHHFLY